MSGKYVCNVCGKEFDEEEYKLTNDSEKCILHCKKEKLSSFYIIGKFDEELRKLYDSANRIVKNVIFPLEYDSTIPSRHYGGKMTFKNCIFNNVIKLGTDNLSLIFEKCKFEAKWDYSRSEVLYNNCIFNEFFMQNIEKRKISISNLLFFDCGFKQIYLEGIIFGKELFKFSNLNKYYDIENLELINCEFNKPLILVPLKDDKVFKIEKLNFTNTIFREKSKVKIQFCEIGDANFYNTKFEDLADFYQTKFNKVNFERTDFEQISVFSEAEFNCDVDFKYTKFIGKAIFRDTVITGSLNLRDSIFDDEANFLDITSVSRKVYNKQDKSKYEFVGEPIDLKVANRETARVIKNFYDESNNIIEANRFYKLEMIEKEKELRFLKNPFEWFVFKIHALSSNHSQNWILALFWIISIPFMYLLFGTVDNIDSIVYNLHIKGFWNEIANLINPFSIMTKGETLTFGMLLFKVTIAYLIYQFIISIRQNTRRK